MKTSWFVMAGLLAACLTAAGDCLVDSFQRGLYGWTAIFVVVVAHGTIVFVWLWKDRPWRRGNR